MTTTDLAGSTAIVTGAGRGFGRGIATALAGAGAHVVGVARTGTQLDEVRGELGDTFTPVSADAADPATAATTNADTFKVQITEVRKNCGGCHQNYRKKT